jgi:hypothetical protein
MAIRRYRRREPFCATGRFGSSRDFPTEMERARTAVRKALVRAVRSISRSEPGLGQHVQQAVMTGTTCPYRADEAWTIQVTRPSFPPG